MCFFSNEARFLVIRSEGSHKQARLTISSDRGDERLISGTSDMDSQLLPLCKAVGKDQGSPPLRPSVGAQPL